MASKRNLKKKVNFIYSRLLAECVAKSLYSDAQNKDDVKALLQSVMMTNRDFVCRISHIEPGMTAKKYFADFKRKYNEQINELIDQIAN